MTFMFCPYTGRPRHPSDIASDPDGVLIVEPGAPLMAARKTMSAADEGWRELPQRLRGRGDFLLQRGRIKDAELMFDAATEIEGLRVNAS